MKVEDLLRSSKVNDTNETEDFPLYNWDAVIYPFPQSFGHRDYNLQLVQRSQALWGEIICKKGGATQRRDATTKESRCHRFQTIGLQGKRRHFNRHRGTWELQ